MLYSYNKIGNFLKRKIGFSNVGDSADAALTLMLHQRRHY
jgi:hypothetical protein